MKSRLTLTVDPHVTHAAKRAARLRNKSLSALVEDLLREVSMVDSGIAPESKQSFSERWAGQLKLDRKEDDIRFQALAEKYDL
jgi:hypothetical protein